jgi:OmpA-OmpF porin, OOP family
MSTMTKIIFGLLVTTAIAWWLHGPMKVGARCAAAGHSDATVAAKSAADQSAGNSAAAASTDAASSAGAAPKPAAPAEVVSCQAGVDGVIKGKTVNFVSGGAAIAVDSAPLLSALAAAMKDCAGVIVEVAGHTDATGGDTANLRLSEERANAVVQALMAENVPGDKLLPKGYGERRLLDASASEAANARNRRIEFIVASQSGDAKPAGR